MWSIPPRPTAATGAGCTSSGQSGPYRQGQTDSGDPQPDTPRHRHRYVGHPGGYRPPEQYPEKQDPPDAVAGTDARRLLALTVSRYVEQLVVSEAAVRKHVGQIFAKPHLGDGLDRRVSAVLTDLRR
ncbi:helix-turn-helix domain-containing protein [Kribbella turkmenica]|uniref:hypothetical protein n=1 Tax=Kribbella turkmenica TaxID=2530375 RepID=UPI001F44C291|nr:hypothetical protein [Kribbella turkmenica]